MEDTWYSSKFIRDLMGISSQYLYFLKKNNKIEWKQISKKIFLYKIPEHVQVPKQIALYARVSTPKQKVDLENQIQALKTFALSQGHILNQDLIFSDIASGMNENRKGLGKLLETVKQGQICQILITHKDRLTRFGFGYLEKICSLYGCKIVCINFEHERDFQEELSEDLIAIIHHFSMKFYGKRKNKVKKLVSDINSLKCK